MSSIRSELDRLQESKHVQLLKPQSESYFHMATPPRQQPSPMRSPASQLADQLAGFSLAESPQRRPDAPTPAIHASVPGPRLPSQEYVQRARASSPASQLAVLVASSALTELSFSLSEISNSIFELQASGSPTSTAISIDPTQELRHSTAPVDPSRPAPDITPVDTALIRLEGTLETTRAEFVQLELQIEPLLASDAAGTETVFLRRKWTDTLQRWESLQVDAGALREELTEDKWLVVFRSVAQQATDMMDSLDKALHQSDQFIADLHRRGGQSGSSNVSSGSYLSDRDVQPLRSSFVALHDSLQGKIKYYSPACSRVLKILDKGIADRSTKNGEVLRRFSDMKLRWRELRERITKVEGEMTGVESLLRDEADDKSASTSSVVDDVALTKPSMSPFRRLASKMKRPSPAPALPRSSSTPTIPRSESSSTLLPASLSRAGQPYARPVAEHSTPSRPPKNANRLSSASAIPRPAYESPSLLPPGKAPSSEYRPRWNYSTRPVADKETLRDATPGRPSLSRSVSRLSMGMRSVGHRASSPTFSSYSDASFAHQRPMTPSRIPLPASKPGATHYNPDPESSSLMARVASPTPSSSHFLSPTKSRLPRRSSLLPPRAPSPAPSASSFRRAVTPEPMLAAQARRLSVYRPPPSASRVPPLPAAIRGMPPRPSTGMSMHAALPGSAASSLAYVPNPLDDLDLTISAILRALPLQLSIERLSPPLTRADLAHADSLSARYFFSMSNAGQRRAVTCKLVDRVGPRAKEGKKVLVRVGGGWLELESYAMGLLGTSL